MAKSISLFSPYAQKEDRVSNYCGLLMKLVYEESPLLFQEVLERLLPADFSAVVGPTFEQQVKIGNSRPDLVIAQKPFRLAFETKNFDWFYDDQIDRHIEGLKDYRDAVLVLLSNFELSDYSARFARSTKVAESNGVSLVPCSFEDFSALFQELDVSPQLKVTIEEFNLFLSAKGLLPEWKYLLDVVSCSRTVSELEEGAYMCPDSGGQYSHRRARWLGAYTGNKTVSRIYHVDGVVAVTDDEFNLRWNNSSESEDELIFRTREIVKNASDLRQTQIRNHGLQIFLLGEEAETSFLKDSKKGLQGSKTYFHGIAKEEDTARALADRLNEKNWSQFR